MEEQNRLRLKISEEMREETRYEDEEISKWHAKINDDWTRFTSAIKEDLAQFQQQIQQQHRDKMAELRSKFDRLLAAVEEPSKDKEKKKAPMVSEDRSAPLDQVNSNPDEPTLEYSASTIFLENRADEMLELNRALDSEENGDYDSIGEEITTKQSSGRLDWGDEASNMLDGLSKPIYKKSEEFPSSLQDGFRLVNETYQQPSLKLRSVGVAHHLFGDLHRHHSVEKEEGNHGTEIAGVLAQVIRTSISDALLTHICFQKNQTWIIMKYVELKNASFHTDIDVRFYFDPGGISVTCFSRGALHPLIGKAPGISVNGMIIVVSSLMDALSVMASRDIHYLVGSIYFYLFSNGIHAIVAVIVDIGTHEDDFTKMDSKAMFEGVNFKLSMESILAYLAHSELVLLYHFEGLFIDNKVIGIPTTYITKSLKNKYFDIFRGASKERMAFLRMCFSTQLVKFAQLSSWSLESSILTAWRSWSLESSILTAWSSVLSYIHNSVKIRMGQRGYYVNNCSVRNSHFNKAPMEHFDSICNNGVTGWSSVELIAALCGITLRNGESEDSCGGIVDETLGDSVKLFLYFFDTDLYAYFTWMKLARMLLFDTREVDEPEVHIMTESQQKGDEQIPIGCFGCDSITFPACRTKAAFIWLRLNLQMVVWRVLNTSIMTSCIEIELTWPAVLVDSRENGIRLVLILLDHAKAIQQASKELYGNLVKRLGFLVVFQADSMREFETYDAELLARRIYILFLTIPNKLAFADLIQLLFIKACLMYLKLVHLTVNQSILESHLENGFVSAIDFCKEQSAQWPMLLQAFASGYGLPFSVQLSEIESHYHDKSVHLRELGWKVDKNVCTFVLRDFIVTSLENLHTFMCEICKDEVIAVNFEREFHPLSEWSWDIKNDLSLVEEYIVRKLKAVDGFLILIPYMLLSFREVSLANSVSGSSKEMELTQNGASIIMVYTNISYGSFGTASCIEIQLQWSGSWSSFAVWSTISKGIQCVMFVGFVGIFNTIVVGYSLETTENGHATNNGCDCQTNIHFQLVSKLKIFVWVSHFTTLRTRRLLRGRICHVPRFKIRKKAEDALVTMNY